MKDFRIRQETLIIGERKANFFRLAVSLCKDLLSHRVINWLLENKVSFRYPVNVHFRCTRCAICCGDTASRVRHILLLRAEAERIAEATSKPIEEFAVRTENGAPYVYEMKKTVDEGRCIFLQKNFCTIYELRPLVCRFYPFEFRATENGKRTFLYTRECPGIGQGEKTTRRYFKELLRQLKASGE